MRNLITILICLFYFSNTNAQNKDFTISSVEAQYTSDLDQYVFEIKVEGKAGNTVPKPKVNLTEPW